MRRAALLLALACFAFPALAQQDPALKAAQDAAAALGKEAVIAIQRDLVLTGDLNSTATGEFGKRTFESIRAFQKRAKAKPTGILDDKTRAALAKAAGDAAKPYGLKSLTANGVTVEYPAALVVNRTEGKRGPKFSAADSRVTVDLLAYPATQEAFEAIFDRLRKERAGRTVPLQAKRDDVFTLGGNSDGMNFYMRFLKTDTDTRGFVLGWDPKLSPGMDRIAVIMAGSLVAASGDAKSPVAEALLPAKEAAEPAKPAGPPVPLIAGVKAGPKQGIGVVVSAEGDVLTSAGLVAGCSTLKAGEGTATVIAGDLVNDIALARLAKPTASFAPLRLSDPVAGESLSLATAPGAVSAVSVSALAGPKDDTRTFLVSAVATGGGMLFDSNGKLVAPVPRADATHGVALRATFVSAFLRANKVKLATEGAGGTAALVALGCDASQP